MSEPSQTTAVKTSMSTVASRYAKFSPSRGYNAKPFHKLFTLFVSLPKTGKSTFIESNPDLLRIDFDRAGTSNPQTACITVPSLQNEDGRTFVITKAWFDELVAQLVDDAKNNRPRPLTVCFDTVDALVSILCDDYAKASGVANFYMLDVKAWGVIYNQIADYCTILIQHGYGLWLCSHIVNKKVEIGEASKMVLDLTMRDTLLARIRGLLDLIVAVEKGYEFQTKEIPKIHPVSKEPLVVNGKAVIDRVETIETPYVDLVVKQAKPKSEFDPDFSRLVGGHRVGGLPDRIRLPRVGGWQKVSSIYEDAARSDGATILS